jgi:hypothetical protein
MFRRGVNTSGKAWGRGEASEKAILSNEDKGGVCGVTEGRDGVGGWN